MSNLTGSIDSRISTLLISADVLLAVAAFVMTILILDYGRTKADGQTARGCWFLSSVLFGVGILQVADLVSFFKGGIQIEVYVRLVLALVGTVVALLMIKQHPHSPDIRIASHLQRQNKLLESSNEALTKERDQAQAQVSLNRAFLSNVSHELRTPLSAVIGMQELLENTELDEEQRQIAEAARDSAGVLLSLVNEVQDLVKAQSGRADLEIVPFGVQSVIHEAISSTAESARKKKLFVNTDIDPDLPERLLGDGRRIKQILVHLINSSIKNTQRGGIIIHANHTTKPGGVWVVRFAVKDTGEGLTEEEQISLFQPFSSSDGKNQHYGDSGLGLYMSKLLVDLMGGSMGVDTIKGQGSVFWFTLNLSPVDSNQTISGAQRNMRSGLASELSEGKVALVVEDNQMLLELAVRQLESLGLKTLSAMDGRSAVELATSKNVDLIFMDCHLPGLDGFEAARSIRELEQSSGKRIPILAMTADTLLDDEKTCTASGMDDVLVKPISLEQLRSKIRKWLSKSVS